MKIPFTFLALCILYACQLNGTTDKSYVAAETSDCSEFTEEVEFLISACQADDGPGVH